MCRKIKDMAIRLSFDGIQFEVDTIEEAVALQQALRGQGRIRSSQSAPATSHRGASVSTSSAVHPADIVFRNAHAPALKALLAAPQGIDTATLTAAIGKPTPKSIPPTIAAWNQRAKAIGLNMAKLLKIERAFDGEKATTKYRLTDEGRKVFGKEPGDSFSF